MTTAAAGQAVEAEAPAFIALSEAPEVREPEAATTETPAESEPTAASTEGTPLDDIEYDENDPAQKAAYEALRKKMLPKWQARVEALKKPSKDGETQPQVPTEQPPQEAVSGEWDPYTVPLAEFTYAGEPEPEDSGIHGFEREIDRRIQEGVKKAIEFTLNQMRANDGRLREQQQVGTARQQIEQYMGTIAEHPEYAEKQAVFQEIASKPWARQMAVEDPEAFITMLEEKSGIPRNWHEATAHEQVQRGQQNQRLATKPLAVVSRPTGRAPAPQPAAGNMTLQASLDKRIKERLGR